MANGQADGSIIIDSEIDSKGFLKDGARLKNAVKSLNEKIAGLGPVFQEAMSGSTKAVNAFSTKSNTLKSKIAEAEAQLKEMANTEYSTTPYTAVTSAIEKQEKGLKKLADKQLDLKAAGKKFGMTEDYESAHKASIALINKIGQLDEKLNNTSWKAKSYSSLQNQLEKVKAEYAEVEQQIKEMEQTGQDIDLSQEWLKVQDQIDIAKNKLASYKAQKEAMENSGSATVSGSDTQAYKDLQAELNNAKKALNDIGGSEKRVSKNLLDVYEGIKANLKSTISAMKNAPTLTAQIGSAYDGFWEKLGDRIANYIRNTEYIPVLDPLLTVADDIKTLNAKLADAIKNLNSNLGNPAEKLYNFAVQKVQAFKGQLPGLKNAIITVFTDPKAAVQNFVSTAQTTFDTIKSKIAPIGTSLKKAFTDPRATLQNFASAAGQAWENFATKAYNIGAQIPSKLNSALGSVLAGVKSLGSHIGTAIKNPLKTATTATRGLAKGLGGTAVAGAKKLKSAVAGAKKLKSAVAGVAKLLKGSVQSGIKKMGKGFTSVGKQITNMRKKLVKMSLVMIGMRGVMGAIRQFATQAREQNEQLSGQLDAIKGVMGQAFMPIINVIIGALSKVITFADRIYSIFSGVSLISKYNAKQTSSMASSTSDAADSAKEYKRQLAGFDELNVLSKDESSSSSDSSSGSSGETEAITFTAPKLSEYLQGIISQIKKGDWESAGASIASGINSVLANINWPDVQSKVNGFCTNLGSAVNGFVSALNWNEVGNAVAQSINTITGAINSFVDTINWEDIGGGIAQALRSIINSIDAEALGKALSAHLKILTDTLYGFFDEISPEELGNGLGSKLATAVNAWFANIDWGKVGSNISDLIKTAFNFGSAFFDNLDEEALAQDIKDFFAGVDWAGIWDAIVDFVSSAITSIDEFLTALFGEEGAAVIEGVAIAIAAVVTALGTFSAVMTVVNAVTAASPVTWIIVGITAAIAALVAGIILCVKHWDEIKEALSKFGDKLKEVKENIKDWAKNLKDKISDWFSKRINDIKDFGTNLITNLKDGIGDVWSKISEKFDEFKTGISTWFTNKVTDFKTFGSNLITNIKDGIGTIWTAISGKFDAFKTSMSTWFTNKVASFKTLGSNVIGNIKDGLGTIWSTLKGKFDTFKTNMSSWFTSKVTDFKNLGSNVIDKIKDGLGNIWNSFKDKFDTFKTNIKNWFTNKATDFKNLGKNIITGIKDGIVDNFQSVINMLKEKVDGMVDKVKEWLGIHSPSRVFKNEIGANIDAGLEEGIGENAKSLISTAAGIASDISDEFANGTYTLSPVSMGDTQAVINGINSFADTITDGFSTLVERLQAIANGVTFATPTAASSIVPYRVDSAANNSDVVDAIYSSNDELESVIAQLVNSGIGSIVDAIKSTGSSNGLSNSQLADIVINDINRRARVLGKSPINI